MYVGNKKLEIDYNYGYGSEDAGLKPYAYEYISSILNMKSLGKVLGACTLRPSRVTQEEWTLQAVISYSWYLQRYQ